MQKAQLLKDKGIDFSCGGNKTFNEAAKDINIEEDR